MADLSTEYLGLTLRNPLIVGSSPFTRSADGVCRCAEAGAGAVVLKSLFEEQLRKAAQGLNDSLASDEHWHSEVYEYLEADISMRVGPRDYIAMIRDAKQRTDIPVIASINCVNAEWWSDFAAEVQAAGADALELNAAIMATWFDMTSVEVEDRYEDIVKAARQAVDIPIAVKLPQAVSSLPHLILRLRRAGADAFVLFNRFYQPTIDVDDMKIVCGRQFSNPEELSPTLRWISLLAGQVDADFAATRGVHSGEDIARCLLAGADAVQVVSALSLNRKSYIGVMLDDLQRWMEKHEFKALADFRGRLSQAQNPEVELFSRFQYLKGLSAQIQSRTSR